jgi:pimeloyl-ACP methyl ester carboxylesterase
LPTGVIWGEADRTVPIRALDDITAARPDVVVARVADAGHVPMIERPEAFVTALEHVLGRLG